MKEPYVPTPEVIAEIARIEAELDEADAEPLTEERIQEILKYVRDQDEKRERHRRALRMLDAIMSHVPELEKGKS